MYASIYGNATLMIQGKGYEKWLKENELKLFAVYRNKQSVKQQSKVSYDCHICNEKDTNDMIKCVECLIWIHKECDIDYIIDVEVEGCQYRCPPCRKSATPNMGNKSTIGTVRTRLRREKNGTQKQLKDVSGNASNNLDGTFTVAVENGVQYESLTMEENPTTLVNDIHSLDKTLNSQSVLPQKTFFMDSASQGNISSVSDTSPDKVSLEKTFTLESESEVTTPVNHINFTELENSGGKSEVSPQNNTPDGMFNTSDINAGSRCATSHYESFSRETDESQPVFTTTPKHTAVEHVTGSSAGPTSLIKDQRSSPDGISYFINIKNPKGLNQEDHRMLLIDDDNSDLENDSQSHRNHVIDSNIYENTDEWLDDDDLLSERYSLVNVENDLFNSYSLVPTLESGRIWSVPMIPSATEVETVTSNETTCIDVVSSVLLPDESEKTQLLSRH